MYFSTFNTEIKQITFGLSAIYAGYTLTFNLEISV